MPHPLFSPEVRELLAEKDAAGMKAFCESLHPATVAEALDEFDAEDVWAFLKDVPIATQADIFEYFPEDKQVQLVEGTGRPHMARLIEQMSSDDRADLLRRLPEPTFEALLRLVDEADRRDIATLVRYEENTAGALMTTDYAWLPAHISAGEALDRLRLQAPDKETIYYIFILDEQRRLQGVVSLRDLILARRTTVLRDLMERDVVTVRASDDREKVAQVIAHFDLLAVPVVDDEGRLVGIVTYDDVMDVVEEEATEDIHRMGGVGPLEENYLEARFVHIWRKRAVWLSCLFVAELFTFTALSHFEDAIAEVVVLSLFVPLCISTGGNSGSQAATLITRALALGHVGVGDWLRILRHELLMGLVLGLTLGVIGYVRAAVTPEGVRASSPPRFEEFQVKVPADQPLDLSGATVTLPPGALQFIQNTRPVEVTLPEGETAKIVEPTGPDSLVYAFPKKCTIRRDPVPRWNLALVIAQSVAAICLWGTLIGSMLPLVFKRLGVDPGIASSPFVATFVDVTGIIIYFSIATVYLLS